MVNCLGVKYQSLHVALKLLREKICIYIYMQRKHMMQNVKTGESRGTANRYLM